MRQHSVTPGSTVTLVAARPTTDQYLHLRAHAGLGSADQKAVENALAGSLHAVCAFRNNQVIACGRIVGDGGLYFYIEDLIVETASRGHGIGGRVLQALLEWLKANAREGAHIGLTASGNASGFFARYGFRESPDARPGMFLPPAALQPGKFNSPSR